MRYAYIVILISVFIACSKDEPENPISNQELSWEYGKNIYREMIDDTLREFIVHVPQSYDGSEAVPMVFMLHGSSGNGNKFYNISKWVELSEIENFIPVFPTALEHPLIENNGNYSTKWASPSIEELVVEGHVVRDDEPFFRGMVDIMKNSFNIDASRIYSCGFSNGGGFTKQVILTRMNDIFAAVATSGGFGMPEKFEVNNNIYLPLYTIVGSRDDRVIENTGEKIEIPLNGEEIMSHELFGAYIRNMLETLGLSEAFTETQNPPSFNLLTFDESTAGQGNEHIVMIVNDLTHMFPNGTNNPQNVRAVDHLWPWFMKYQK